MGDSTVFKTEKKKHKVGFYSLYMSVCCWSFADVGPPLDADFDFMRDKGRFGQGHRWFFFRSLHFPTLWSGPPALPASGLPSRANFSDLSWPISEQNFSVFDIPSGPAATATAASLVDAVLLLPMLSGGLRGVLAAGQGRWFEERRVGELHGFLQRAVSHVF